MASSAATTVDAYLAELPPDRREAISRVRDVVNANLPAGYEEGMQYGMIGWYVPLARYPDTYNGQPLGIAALASQKNYMALYLNGVYSNPAIETWFRAAYKAAGKKLDMGKSCVRFTSIDALPLDVIGQTIAKVGVEDYLATYEAMRAGSTNPKAREVRTAKAPRPAKSAKAKPAKKTKKTSGSKPKAKSKAKPKKR